jgi:ligand-binding sensor domain-containing protein
MTLPHLAALRALRALRALLSLLALTLSACDPVPATNPYDPAASQEAQRPGEVSGRLTLPAGVPSSALEGASVTLRLLTALGASPLAATPDAGGRFAFSELTPGSYELLATVTAFLPIRYAVTVTPGEVMYLGDLPLEPRVSLSTGDVSVGVEGVVTRGGAAAGAHGGVFVEALGTAFATLSGSDGAFYLPLPPRAHTLRFSAEGYEPALRFDVQVSADQPSRLGEPVTLTPLESVVVGTVSVDGSLTPSALDRLVVRLMDDPLSPPESALVTATADPDGRFALQGAPPGPRWVRVSCEGYEAQARPVVVALGVSTSAGHFDLRSPAQVIPTPPALLRGAVELEGASAHGAVIVEARAEGALVASTRPTNAGEYALTLPPRDYLISLSASGYSPRELYALWDPEDARFEVAVETAAGVEYAPLAGRAPVVLPADLSGSLAGCLRSPLSAAERGAWPEVATVTLVGPTERRAVTPDVGGCFEITRLPPAFYGLEVVARGHLTLTRLFDLRAAPQAEPLTLELTPTPPSPPALLRGLVRLGAGSLPTANHSGVLVVARLISPEGVLSADLAASTLSDPTGGFSLALERASHQLLMTSAGYVPRALRVDWSDERLQFEVREAQQVTPTERYLVTLSQDLGPDGDVDLDGVSNRLDNCPNLFNPPRVYGEAQEDLDGDDVGDPCDSDQDGDELSDLEELAARLDPRARDTDRDGLGDGLEILILGTSGALTDSDRDGRLDPDELTSAPLNAPMSFDFAPYDADDDGVVSLREALAGGVSPADLDGDGLIDAVERADVDSDGDGAVDQLDGPGALGDLDGDGILNGARTPAGVCVDPVYCDPCPNARDALDLARSTPTRPVALDADRDGRGDACDEDDDADGEPDVSDNCRLVANPSQLDTDRDGRGDACDEDDDADGLPDALELQLGSSPLLADTDRDGVPDGLGLSPEGAPRVGDNCPVVANLAQVDTDADGRGDACDADDDGDGVLDAADLCPLVADRAQLNADGDAFGDACDLDDDNDGALDARDNCPLSANPDQGDVDLDGRGDRCDEDDDNDGVLDANDNCPDVFNPDQRNSTGGPTGDLCSLDVDGDGVVDAADNCVEVFNPLQRDLDLDGLGDVCDVDADGDGVDLDEDLCPLDFDPRQEDMDADGVGDACDEDDDNDAVLDLSDSCPLKPNVRRDGDGDMVDDACDVCPAVYDLGQRDLDRDGLGDACDPDRDGDAVVDTLDNCPTRPNPTQADRDADGVGDACAARFEAYLSDRAVRDVARLGDEVWVASEGGGLTRWRWSALGGADAGGAYARERHTTSEGAPSNVVRHIALNAQGDLRALTDRGLATRYASSGAWELEAVRRLTPGVDVPCLEGGYLLPWAAAVGLDVDRLTGRVYVAFEGAVVRLDGGALRCWRRGVELPNHAVRDVSVSPLTGEVWASTDGGAYRYSPQVGWQGFTRPLLRSDKVQRVGFSADGRVWALSLELGVKSHAAFNPTTEVGQSASGWPAAHTLAALLPSPMGLRAPSGALWVFDEALPGLTALALSDLGAPLSLSLSREPHFHPDPLDNTGAPLLEGPNGRLLHQGHQLIITPSEASATTPPTSPTSGAAPAPLTFVPSRSTLSFGPYVGFGADARRGAVSASQGVWGAHPEGLTYEGTLYTALDGLPTASVRDVDLDLLGQAWVAARGGVSHRRQGRFYTYPLSPTLGAAAGELFAVEVDREGRAWVGARGGVWRFDGVRFHAVGDLSGAALPPTYDLLTGAGGELWAATAGGLYRRVARDPSTLPAGVDPLAFELVSLVTGGEPTLTALAQMTDGRLLAASPRGLFARTPQGVTRQYTEADGLPSAEVVDVRVVEAGLEGLAWVSTSAGLARFTDPLSGPLDLTAGPARDPSPPMSADEAGVTWVSVAGAYLSATSSEPPSASAWVEPFEVSRQELTVAQWASLTGELAPPADEGALPLIVSDPAAFAATLAALSPLTDARGRRWSLSLPTHEEWALLAQGARPTHAGLYPWSEAPLWGEGVTCDQANTAECGAEVIPPCGAPLGGGPLALCDLGGNVSEWALGAGAGWLLMGGSALSPSREARVTAVVVAASAEASARAPVAARGVRLVRRPAP